MWVVIEIIPSDSRRSRQYFCNFMSVQMASKMVRGWRVGKKHKGKGSEKRKLLLEIYGFFRWRTLIMTSFIIALLFAFKFSDSFAGERGRRRFFYYKMKMKMEMKIEEVIFAACNIKFSPFFLCVA